MQKMDLKSYFDTIGYDWKKDEKAIKAICKLTKTRVRTPEHRNMWGSEQQFLIKAIAENLHAKQFFEIGTGRGTTCYTLSLIPEIEKIVTIDLLPFRQKRETAVNYTPAVLSNKDFYDAVSFDQKKKIIFYGGVGSKTWDEVVDYKDAFDLVFIDGNHDDPDIIMDDFYVSEFVLREGGIILFDDYGCEWGKGVTKVVDEVLEDGGWEGTLVEFRGHLFEGDKPPEKDQGMVILKRRDS